MSRDEVRISRKKHFTGDRFQGTWTPSDRAATYRIRSRAGHALVSVTREDGARLPVRAVTAEESVLNFTVIAIAHEFLVRHTFLLAGECGLVEDHIEVHSRDRVTRRTPDITLPHKAKRAATSSLSGRPSDTFGKATAAFSGVWAFEDDTEASGIVFTIRVRRAGFAVSVKNFSTGEQFVVRQVVWNGVSLTFKCLIPSMKHTNIHKFVFDGEDGVLVDHHFESGIVLMEKAR